MTDIRTVDGVLLPTFKDACYSIGLLGDDKEYIDGITQANSWGSTFFMRKFFAMLLMSSSISRPKYVWDNTWKMLSEDVLRRQRRILQMQCNFIFLISNAYYLNTIRFNCGIDNV
jgi:hypothetical protein